MVERSGIPLLRPWRGSRSRPLAGLIQAGFDHRLLERSPDVLAYADAPLVFESRTIVTITQKTPEKGVFCVMAETVGFEPTCPYGQPHFECGSL